MNYPSIEKNLKLFLILFFGVFCCSSFSVAQTASFNATPDGNCTPINVEFEDTSTDATSWSWDFGNSNTSTSQNPSANYPQAGVYTVTLTINGGSSSASQNISVYPHPNPVLDDNKEGCEPFTTTLSVDITPVTVADFTIGSSSVGGIAGGNATKVTWDFLGALPTVEQNITAGATNATLPLNDIPAGIYDLFLTVEDEHGCTETIFEQDAIIVNAQPTTDFSFIKDNNCGVGNVNFNGTSEISFGIISSHSWDIGNDGSVEGTTPNFDNNFSSAGTYDVAYYVTSNDGCVSEKTIKQVEFNNNNQIDFSYSGSCVGQPVSFSDASSLVTDIISWEWDFDNDGNTDNTNQNPEYTFSSTGDYPVKLTVTFDDGCILEKTDTVTINGASANFIYDSSSSCSPDYQISFTNTSTKTDGTSITGYSWDFDNDNNEDSSSENPLQNFGSAGTFPVTLTVTTSDGCQSSNTIDVVIPESVVDFLISPSQGCESLDVSFSPVYNNSSDPIISYSWNFGDGNSSTAINPSNTYNLAGDYTATLTVETTNGCNLTAQNPVLVGTPQEITDIIVTPPLNSCQTGSFEFEAEINTFVDSVVWTFSDVGGEEYQLTDNQNSTTILHGFSTPSQTHSVTATAYYNGCPSAAYTIDNIVVNEPTANFSVDSDVLCSVPATVNFSNNSISNDANTNYTWDFGDGTSSNSKSPSHSYSSPGDYTVTLDVENTITGCTDQATRNIYVMTAAPDFTADNTISCAGSAYDVNFSSDLTNVSSNFTVDSYVWNFGDGNSSTLENPTHSYADPGLYDVSLQITEERGCVYAVSVKEDFVDVRGPIVSFTNDPTIICSGTSVDFTNNSSKADNDPAVLANDSYLWDFGDGDISTDENSTHEFISPGTYDVTLQVTDENGCVSSFTKTNSVEVPDLIAEFSSQDIYCLGDEATFDASATTSTAPITSYDWDLDGDGTYEIVGEASSQNYTFPAIGSFTVNLRVTNNINCVDEYTKAFTIVDGTGTFSFQPSNLGCAPVNVQFEPADPDSVVASYTWDFGDGGVSTNRTPAHFYTTPGDYTVTLTVTLTGGCTKTSSQTITIAGAVGDFSYDNTPGCTPHPENFFAENLSSVEELTWDFGDGTTFTETVNDGETEKQTSHTYTSWGTRLPILILRDAICGDYAYYFGQDQRINTSEAPNANFGCENIQGQTCEGQTFQFTDSSSIVDPRYPVGEWFWDFGDGATSTAQNPIHFYDTDGTFDVTLRVKTTFNHEAPPDEENCWAEITKSIQVNPLPDISATNKNQRFCSGSSSSNIELSSTLSGTTFDWERDNPTGISTTAAISGTSSTISGSVFENTTNAPTKVTYVLTPVGPDPTNCEGDTIHAVIWVDPIPVITSDNTSTICSGDNVDYGIVSNVSGTTFEWSRESVTGIDESGVSGQTADPISEALTNTTNAPIDVEYEIIPSGPSPTSCKGSEFTLTVTVNPEPVVSDQVETEICSRNSTGVILGTNHVSTSVAPAAFNIININSNGLSASAGNPTTGTAFDETEIANDAWINTTGSNVDVVYTVIPMSSDGCEGNSFTVTIPVKPEPVASDGSVVICSGQTLNFSLLNQVTSLQTGVTFTYTVSSEDETNVPAPSDRTVASDANLSDSYSNSANSPVNVTYVVTPIAANSCSGQEFSIIVTVNPDPQIDSPGSQVYCNDDSETLNFSTQNTGGTTTYSWTNNNTAIGLGASGGGNLSFTPTNSGTSPITANITVTPTFENGGTSCTGNPETFSITVNPNPQVDAIGNQELCNGESTNLIAFTTNNTGGTTTYSWTIDESIGLSPQLGTGDISAFTAINSGVEPIIATIEVVPQFENGGKTCYGPSESFTITVNPTPVVSSKSETTICSSEALDYEITSETTGTTFSWTATNNVGTVTGFSSSGTSSTISDVLTNAGAANGEVTYTITPEANDCPGPEFKLKVTVLNCEPKIGVAKQLVSISYNEDGTAEVLFNIRVQNYGNVVLEDIQVVEDLATEFLENYEVLELSSTSFDVNTSFDGISDQNLLNNSGTSNVLAVGASTNITLKVKVLSPRSYTNQVMASSPSSGGTSDDSQNGSDPDPDGDGHPGNNNDETPVEIGSCTLTADVTQNTTCGNPAGQITLTGSEAGKVILNGVERASPATFTGLQAGWYTATFIADATGCIASNSFEITNSNSDLVASVTNHKDVSCHNGNDGEIEVTATGGSGTYDYYLIDGEIIDSSTTNTTGSFSNDTLALGEYSVRVEDTNGCTYTVSFDIDEPTELLAEIASSGDVSCNGGSDGTATVNATGGTAPYTYAWDDGSSQTTATATGLAAGTYTVTVTDVNSCTTSASITIDEPESSLVISSANEINPSCYDANDGSVEITVNGGTVPYSYLWNNGQATKNATSLAEGSYTITVTDSLGCTAIGGPYDLISPDIYTVDAGKDTSICSSEVIKLEGSSNVNVRWTTSGTGTFDDATLPSAEYTPSEADIEDAQVQLTLTTDENGSCANISDQMVLTIWKQPIVYAGLDAVSPIGEPYQVLDAEAANYSSLIWTHDGSGFLSGETTLSPVYTPQNGETGVISLVLEAFSEGSDVCTSAKDTMTISIGEEPEISVEKRTVQVILNNDGSTDITFEFNLENTGNVDLGNISITDDLASSFPGSCNITVLSKTSDNFNVNGSFDGISDTQILTGGNTLEVLAKKAVLLTVRISGCDQSQTSFTNQAIAQGTSAGNETVSDTDNSFISIEEDPIIGLSKQLVSQTSNGDDTHTLVFNIRVENFGTVSLNDIFVGDDLEDAFGSENYVVESITSEQFAVNENYSGGTGENLLASSNYLEPSEVGAVQLTVTVLSSVSYSNQAETSGISPRGTEVTDISQSGTDPDPDADNDPTNNNEPTEINLEECVAIINCPGLNVNNRQVTPGECGYVVAGQEFDATAGGGCELVSLTHDYELWNSSTLAGATLPVGSTTITWTAEYASGNMLSCPITVVVEDNDAPYFVNCPSGTTFTVGLSSGACEGGAMWSIPVAMDNCSEVSVVQTQGPAQGSVLGVGTYPVQYRATDSSGNTVLCSFTVRVTDTEDPVIVCQPDLIKETNSGNCTWISPSQSLSPLLANSNCPADVVWQVTNPDGSVNTGEDDVSGYAFELGESEVQYSIAENSSGQTWDCSFKVTVTDGTSPQIICQPTMELTTNPGECSASVELISPDVFDNCSQSEVSVQYRVYNADNTISSYFDVFESTYKFQEGLNRIKWIAEDINGNSEFCWQNVWVTVDSDTLKPFAGENAAICQEDSFKIDDATAPSYAKSINWTTNGTGHFINSSEVNPTYVPSPGDILNGMVVLTMHSFSECATASDDILVSISTQPLVDAGPDLSACFGQPVDITGSTAENFSSLSWSSNGNGTIEKNNTIAPVYIPAEGETGIIQLQLMAMGQDACLSDTVYDSAEIEVLEPLVVNAGKNDTIFYNSSALLDVNVENGSGAYFYYWSPEALVLDPNAGYTETVDLTSDIDFHILVKDAQTGCESSDFIVVYVEEETDKLVGFYNGFTPNNDGVNDNWFIEGIERFPNNEVMIFNRWGDKIIELRNYDNKNIVWNGTNQRGKKLPDGTYYYVVTLNNDKSYTGWIHLRSER